MKKIIDLKNKMEVIVAWFRKNKIIKGSYFEF